MYPVYPKQQYGISLQSIKSIKSGQDTFESEYLSKVPKPTFLQSAAPPARAEASSRRLPEAATCARLEDRTSRVLGICSVLLIIIPFIQSSRGRLASTAILSQGPEGTGKARCGAFFLRPSTWRPTDSRRLGWSTVCALPTRLAQPR